MKSLGVYRLVKCMELFVTIILLTIISASGMSRLEAQDADDQAIRQAQGAVREQILNREGGRERGRDQTVLFNRDATSEFKSNTEVRVRGTGTFSFGNDSRNNQGRLREFSYEAIVGKRYRNNTNNVSGIRYNWRGGWSGNGRDRDASDNNGYEVQSIYCASDDGRRHTCPINTSGGAVRLVTRRSGSNCVQGRTWGFNNVGIWVDRGCRADFEVSGGRDSGNNGYGNDDRGGRRNNNGGYGNVTRPSGRVSYSGPIMNRHSDKALDVTEQGLQDGADIQQWSYADQPNQNWDVIDLGGDEVAIISRHSGRALTVQGGRDNNGANIIQRGWNNTRQQRWRLERTGGDYYRILSVDNGKCLDVTEQGKENGAHIQLWDYVGQANQQWRLKR